MTLRMSLLTAVSLLAVALAGCSSDDDGGAHGFFVAKTPADPVTEPFLFEATVSGDSYEWDMGDGRAKQSGKSVEYVYGFTDGVVKPKLTVVSGGESTVYAARAITLGTGQNQDPTLQMSVGWDWITAGEQVTLSGAGSTDPDGDPLLFSWFCQRVSDIGVVVAGAQAQWKGDVFRIGHMGQTTWAELAAGWAAIEAAFAAAGKPLPKGAATAALLDHVP